MPGFGGSENATRARDPAPLAPRFRSHQSRVLRDRRSSDRPGGLPSATHTGTRRYASLRPVGRMNRKGPCIPARWIVAQRYLAPGGIRDLPLPSRPRRSETRGMPVHGMTHPPEMNLNGESGNLVWVRVPRTWVPLELKDSLEGIYAPMFGVGSRNVTSDVGAAPRGSVREF